MKRNWLTAAVILLIATMLAACGGNGTNDTTGSKGSNAEATDANAQVTKGSADASPTPAESPRVIGLSVVYPEFLYALGITPIAVQNYHSEFPSYLAEGFSETRKLGIARTPDFEAILAAEPDLILAPVWWADKDYDQLSQIASTVLLPQRDDWRDELRDIAAVFGKEAEAEKVIEDLKSKAEEAAQTLDTLIGDETVLYMRIMAKEIVIHGENSARGQVIHKDLGLRMPAKFPESGEALSISLEVLPEYDADHIIVQLDDESSEEVKSQYEVVLSSALWSNLTAVKKDQVYMAKGNDWFNVGMSPLADGAAIDTVLDMFQQKKQ